MDCGWLGHFELLEKIGAAPSDTFTGDVDVQVIAANGTKSPVCTVALARYSPGFFLYQVASAKYPVAHVGSEFIGKSGLVTGLVTRPVKPGETITLSIGGVASPSDILVTIQN